MLMVAQTGPDKKTPKDAFRTFLERIQDDGWISDYKWVQAESYPALKQKLGKVDPLTHSRSHKKAMDGTWWALDVEAFDGTSVGVDLELLIQRPILDNPEWITNRLGIARTSTPKNIIEEWSLREASFKAFYPGNSKMLLSQFKRTSPQVYSIYSQKGDLSVQVRSAWIGPWVLSFAWRTREIVMPPPASV